MEEILSLVQQRFNKIEQLVIQINSGQTIQGEIIRKAKEEEKYRREKENWIINVLRIHRLFSYEQKQILILKTEAIMKLIWPGFEGRKKQKNQPLENQQLDSGNDSKLPDCEEDLDRKYIQLFDDFFEPYYTSYAFRITHAQVIRTGQKNIQIELLRYLLEMSRDCFKKLTTFFSSIEGNEQQQLSKLTNNQDLNSNNYINITNIKSTLQLPLYQPIQQLVQQQQYYQYQPKKREHTINFPCTLIIENSKKSLEQKDSFPFSQDLYFQCEFEGRLRKQPKDLLDLKLICEQLFEIAKNKNSSINTTIMQYFNTYTFKYPQRVEMKKKDQNIKQSRSQSFSHKTKTTQNEIYSKTIWKRCCLNNSSLLAPLAQQILPEYKKQLSQQLYQQQQQQQQQYPVSNVQNLRYSSDSNLKVCAQLKIIRLTDVQCKLSPYLHPNTESMNKEINQSDNILNSNDSNLLKPCQNSSNMNQITSSLLKEVVQNNLSALCKNRKNSLQSNNSLTNMLDQSLSEKRNNPDLKRSSFDLKFQEEKQLKNDQKNEEKEKLCKSISIENQENIKQSKESKEIQNENKEKNQSSNDSNPSIESFKTRSESAESPKKGEKVLTNFERLVSSSAIKRTMSSAVKQMNPLPTLKNNQEKLHFRKVVLKGFTKLHAPGIGQNNNTERTIQQPRPQTSCNMLEMEGSNGSSILQMRALSSIVSVIKAERLPSVHGNSFDDCKLNTQSSQIAGKKGMLKQAIINQKGEEDEDDGDTKLEVKSEKPIKTQQQLPTFLDRFQNQRVEYFAASKESSKPLQLQNKSCLVTASERPSRQNSRSAEKEYDFQKKQKEYYQKIGREFLEGKEKKKLVFEESEEQEKSNGIKVAPERKTISEKNMNNCSSQSNLARLFSTGNANKIRSLMSSPSVDTKSNNPHSNLKNICKVMSSPKTSLKKIKTSNNYQTNNPSNSNQSGFANWSENSRYLLELARSERKEKRGGGFKGCQSLHMSSLIRQEAERAAQVIKAVERKSILSSKFQ